MEEVTVTELNEADSETFVDILGEIYETSPWVARQAEATRPFDSVEEIEETMQRVVTNASREKKLELLRAHPDLGERTAMTDASEKEQASAGLDELSEEQYEAFQRLNEQYREKFGFPFIMAVKDESPAVIRNAMEKRVQQSESAEFQTALEEVHTIAALRLDELVTT